MSDVSARLFPGSESAPHSATGSRLEHATVADDKLNARATAGVKKSLRITACSDSSLWYRDLVGQSVPYCGRWPEGYASREPAGFSNVVRFEDAELVEVTA
jgi:hypothetical protein